MNDKLYREKIRIESALVGTAHPLVVTGFVVYKAGAEPQDIPVRECPSPYNRLFGGK